MTTPSGYREQPAPPGLGGLVACLWRDETTSPREQRVLPDGCIDLIWMDGAVHVAGPDTAAFLVPHRPGRPIAGLRFHPGAAPAVLGVPAHVLRDQRVRLDELWPGAGWTQRIADDPPTGLTALVT
ncbi:MAG TPA: DUF6597 domain-containing transcriptional factor, partial [Pseudonocardiaceae bacterium]|nr:DUF6597 domain-containing transcriptional factor [Pseudonocardiaceae bacterium]